MPTGTQAAPTQTTQTTQTTTTQTTQTQATPAATQATPAAQARPAASAAPASSSRISNLQVSPNLVNKIKGGLLLVLNLAAHVTIGYGIYRLMISATSFWMLALCGYALYRTFVHTVKDYDDNKALMLKQN